ncbi:hypothetical protein [Desulfocicer niacini]
MNHIVTKPGKWKCAPRVDHIKNTLHMEIMSISRVLADEITPLKAFHVKGNFSALSFDPDERLSLLW